MTFGSLFSGIGGFELALERAGMSCIWQAEKDEHCQRVLAHHWPNVQRFKDVKAVTKRASRPDVVCGGWPCQDLSVAGKRAGLAGERSGLFHQVVRIARALTPRWLFLENVPGLLSSWTPEGDAVSDVAVEPGRERRVELEEGSDFATVIAELVGLGYGLAWRVFDAQYFDLAQRRERVFIVGCLGDAARAAAVLFEPVSCDGDSPPRREAGQRVAATARSRSANPGVNPPGRGGEDDANLVCGTLQAHQKRHGHAMGTQQAAECGQLIAHAARARTGSNGSPERGDASLVTCPLTSHPYGDNESRDSLLVTAYRTSGNSGVMEQGDCTAALNTGTDPNQQLIATVQAHHARNCPDDPLIFEPTCARNGRGQPDSKARALRASEDGGRQDCKPHLLHGRTVRRLTPVECLRLQGFPDNWLDLDPALSDSAKYRMCGNSVAVPCVEWIARRIKRHHKEN